MESIGTFLGLTSAGLAIALHDTMRIWRGFIYRGAEAIPSGRSDRDQWGAGDVIDVRLFQFSIVGW